MTRERAENMNEVFVYVCREITVKRAMKKASMKV
jgi:hypothetical protein